MDMNIYIIWGFLGSGKTTLINYLLSSYLSGKKVVVIENESGTESVDSVLLRSKNYQVKDLNSGCILYASSRVTYSYKRNRNICPTGYLVNRTFRSCFFRGFSTDSGY